MDKPQLDIDKCAKNLCEVRLFKGLDQPRLNRIAELCEFLCQQSGDCVIQEGTDAYDVFILLTGEVSISKKLKLPHTSGIETTERILNRLTAENFPLLGENALVGSPQRNATVRCTTDCDFYRLDARELKQLMNDDPLIGYTVCEQLCFMLRERLESANSDVVKLSTALVFALEE